MPELRTGIYVNADRATMDAFILNLFDPTTRQVLCNAPYDLGVITAHDPALFPAVFQALEDGRIHDIRVREKLINLSASGRLEFIPMPDGSSMRINYSLAELETLYGVSHGVDRAAEKRGDDSLRLNYHKLDGAPLADWPADAREYPQRDASGTLLVWEGQEARLAAEQVSVVTQELRVAAAFCLRLMTCWGFPIDLAKRDEVLLQVQAELGPDKIGLLTEVGILRQPVPPKTYSTGRVTKGRPPTCDTKTLHKIITQTCEAHGLEIKYTPSGNVCADKEVMERVAPFDPALKQYQHRQYLQQLANTELPRLSGARVHPNYNELVETGRVSSFGNSDSKGDAAAIPSCNITNVSSVRRVKHAEGVAEINVRHCYVPDPGWVLCSVDFASIEFVSMAQKCFSLFGHSVMRDLINRGVDPHAYLGAQLALQLEPDFAAVCYTNRWADPFVVLDAFLACKDSPDRSLSDFFKKYRKLAKPVGFGYPGGLGPRKFIEFARKDPYNLIVTQEEAQTLKRIWFETYPEIREYFDWITSECVDPNNVDSEGRACYTYTTPLGMVRAGATYTSACNGALLQSPAAEGALLAVFDVTRACYDETRESCLYGCRPLAFIHDDIVLAIPEDSHMHERAFEQARLQISAMKTVMPDVEVRAVPALMRRWDKEAEAVYDANQRLTVWEPKPKH